VFNATFNNISVISWGSVVLVEGTGVPGENHRPAASYCQTLSHNVVSSTPRFELTLMVICSDCIGSCKSNYHIKYKYILHVVYIIHLIHIVWGACPQHDFFI
jgi:hypothetical protein